MSTTEPPGWRHGTAHVNGIRLHYVEAGEGPLVLMVHGFPESWYSWRHQLGSLSAAGYRAVAIDVRGYGRSSKPVAIDAYRMLCKVADNVALVRALGEDQAVIVGHDWGAPIAWHSALLRSCAPGCSASTSRSPGMRLRDRAAGRSARFRTAPRCAIVSATRIRCPGG